MLIFIIVLLVSCTAVNNDQLSLINSETITLAGYGESAKALVILQDQFLYLDKDVNYSLKSIDLNTTTKETLLTDIIEVKDFKKINHKLFFTTVTQGTHLYSTDGLVLEEITLPGNIAIELNDLKNLILYQDQILFLYNNEILKISGTEAVNISIYKGSELITPTEISNLQELKILNHQGINESFFTFTYTYNDILTIGLSNGTIFLHHVVITPLANPQSFYYKQMFHQNRIINNQYFIDNENIVATDDQILGDSSFTANNIYFYDLAQKNKLQSIVLLENENSLSLISNHTSFEIRPINCATTIKEQLVVNINNRDLLFFTTSCLNKTKLLVLNENLTTTILPFEGHEEGSNAKNLQSLRFNQKQFLIYLGKDITTNKQTLWISEGTINSTRILNVKNNILSFLTSNNKIVAITPDGIELIKLQITSQTNYNPTYLLKEYPMTNIGLPDFVRVRLYNLEKYLIAKIYSDSNCTNQLTQVQNLNESPFLTFDLNISSNDPWYFWVKKYQGDTAVTGCMPGQIQYQKLSLPLLSYRYLTDISIVLQASLPKLENIIFKIEQLIPTFNSRIVSNEPLIYNISPDTPYQYVLRAVDSNNYSIVSPSLNVFTDSMNRPVIKIMKNETSPFNTTTGFSDTAILEVSNINIGDKIAIYEDDNCTTLIHAQEIALGSIFKITTPLSSGNNIFYAKRTAPNNAQVCSSTYASYYKAEVNIDLETTDNHITANFAPDVPSTFSYQANIDYGINKSASSPMHFYDLEIGLHVINITATDSDNISKTFSKSTTTNPIIPATGVLRTIFDTLLDSAGFATSGKIVVSNILPQDQITIHSNSSCNAPVVPMVIADAITESISVPFSPNENTLYIERKPYNSSSSTCSGPYTYTRSDLIISVNNYQHLTLQLDWQLTHSLISVYYELIIDQAPPIVTNSPYLVIDNPGTYNLIIRAYDGNNIVLVKEFTGEILGINPATLTFTNLNHVPIKDHGFAENILLEVSDFQAGDTLGLYSDDECLVNLTTNQVIPSTSFYFPITITSNGSNTFYVKRTTSGLLSGSICSEITYEKYLASYTPFSLTSGNDNIQITKPNDCDQLADCFIEHTVYKNNELYLSWSTENPLEISDLLYNDHIRVGIRYIDSDGFMTEPMYQSTYVGATCQDLPGGNWILIPPLKNSAVPSLKEFDRHVVQNNSDLSSTNGFCIMQYEARNNGGEPLSTEIGLPWNNITQTNADLACKSLGTNFRLPTNAERMIIAASIESSSENWTNLNLYDGYIPNGNQGGSLQDSTSGESFRRLKINNDLGPQSYLWDFVGNLQEHMIWNLDNYFLQSENLSGIDSELTLTIPNGANLFNKENVLPLGIIQKTITNSLAFGLGKLILANSPKLFFTYGGAYNSNTGIYHLEGTSDLDIYANSSTGFRCVYTPTPKEPTATIYHNDIEITNNGNFFDTGKIIVRNYETGTTVAVATDSNCTQIIESTTPTNSSFSVDLNFTRGINNYFIKTNNSCTGPFYYKRINCGELPGNWVFVPRISSKIGDGLLKRNLTQNESTDGFCIMQFEMKLENNLPVSKSEGLPISGISQTEANELCHRLGPDFRIPTNYEWMTVALNIEAQNDNWYDQLTDTPIAKGSPNSYINRGNHLGTFGILDGSSPLAGKNKRTHYIKNGLSGNDALIWDISGNLAEWTLWSKDFIQVGHDQIGTHIGFDIWQIFNDASNTLTKNYNLLPQSIYDSSITTYNATLGLGFYNRNPASGLGAPLRGGSINLNESGIFALDFSKNSTTSTNLATARCVYIP